MPHSASVNRDGSAVESRFIVVFFCLLMGFNLWAVSVGWNHTNLPGNEFRQAQTGISALFIKKDSNFSLRYPTPILGPPWSLPFEFPLYQWTVAGVSNITGISLTSAARATSAVCFYLGLPALYFLLSSLGLSRPHRLVVLSFMLSCPLYIFFARAFLIETMALMFGLWYLAALVRIMKQPSFLWLLIANIAGAGAGLVKVTTFLAVLIPAFACSVIWLWREAPWKPGKSTVTSLKTFSLLLAIHLFPFACTYAWIHYSDAIKAAHPHGDIFRSANLTAYNFGLGRRFEAALWAQHLRLIFSEIARPVTFVAAAIACVFFVRRWLWLVAAMLIVFFLAQLVFPLLYAFHDYYYVAIGFLPLIALGVIALSAFQNLKKFRWIAYALLLLLNGLQITTYLKGHYIEQAIAGDTKGGLARAIKATTDDNDIIVIAGEDWNSILPYYAQRKALMILGHHEWEAEYLDRSRPFIQGQFVGALVLLGDQQNNHFLVNYAQQFFDIDPRPVFSWKDNTVYLSRYYFSDAVKHLETNHYDQVLRLSNTPDNQNILAGRVISYAELHARHKALFKFISPAPDRFFSSFGPYLLDDGAGHNTSFSIHPETRLWFKLPVGEHTLKSSIKIMDAAYAGIPISEATDGVEVTATITRLDGQREVIGRRYLNPASIASDRGWQPLEWPFTSKLGEELELSVTAGPKGNINRDWAALGPTVIR